MIRFETSLGAFTIELFDKEAPLSAQNFLDYVDSGPFRQHRVPSRDSRAS